MNESCNSYIFTAQDKITICTIISYHKLLRIIKSGKFDNVKQQQIIQFKPDFPFSQYTKLEYNQLVQHNTFQA